MTGHRIGYAAAREDVINGMAKIQSHVTGNIPPFIQEGALQALVLGQKHIEETRLAMQRKAELAHQIFHPLFKMNPQRVDYISILKCRID